MFANWLAPPATSLPPDTIIEVGPPPFTRYAAHSALISAHSGYLRAALRSENGSGESMPIYVPNVTAEQFTPLLTYMYTGFLDLNIENIFGVLLATHILHMPRALELCRAFLSATQTENYFGSLVAISTGSHGLAKLKPDSENSKVVRPIASKATGIGLNFIAPPTSHILLPSTHTPFKSLSATDAPVPLAENVENSSTPPGSTKLTEQTENATSGEQPAQVVEEEFKSSKEPSQKRQSKSVKRNSTRSESVVTSATKDLSANDKGVIIDIASCDGPVRFRRVLNDSYGINSNNICPPDESKGPPRYMSSSFHQQMVRNINERKHTLSNESYNSKDENSQDTNQFQCNVAKTSSTTGTTTLTNETYSCVYCNHTFKSQYCYQKHAKRHLIPLSLESTANVAECIDDSEKEASTKYSKPNQLVNNLKREVKPLDMNVQYYPCKTCGSKFPSYYFVHKHRKMCHAEEEI